MGRNKQLVKNISFIVVGNIGSKLMGFFMLPLYTRWLSPEDFGTVDMISVYALLLLNVVACDVSDAIFVFPSGESKERVKRFYSTGFFFQVICSFLCALLFFFLSLLPYDYIFFSHIWFVYGILISSLFQKYSQDFCRGINKMSVFSFTGIIQSLSVASFSFLFILPLGVYGYVLALILSNVITAFFSFVYSKSYRYLSIGSFRLIELKEMLRYSVPLIPSAILWWLVLGLNRPLLEQYVGMFAIGLLAVSNKLSSMMSMVYDFFQQAWLITVLQEHKRADFSAYFNKTYRVIIIIQSFVCLLLIMCSKMFIHLMTTESYYDAWQYIPIISIGILFTNTTAFIGTLFWAFKQTKYEFYTAIMGGLTAIPLNFLLIPWLGLWGACFAIVLSRIFSAVMRILYAQRFVTFRNSFFLLKQIVLLTTCYLFCLLTDFWLLFGGYVLSVFGFVWINRGDISNVNILVQQKILKRNK